MSDDEISDLIIKPLVEAIWEALHGAWEDSGSAATVGTILSLLMCRFLPESHASMLKHHPARTPDFDKFVELALEVHTGAIRKGCAVVRKKEETRQ